MNKSLSALALLLSCAAIGLALNHQNFQRIDAGGHTVRVLQVGFQGPTVIFEAGAGSPLESWVRVQPAVSKFARTLSYDRAGNGASPRGPTPRDGKQVASELHTLLKNANATPPYILVGHSLGGPYIRVFAGMYPNEVAGMVLVDPTQEELIAWSNEREHRSPKQNPRPWDEVDCAPLTFDQASHSSVPSGIPVTLINGMGPQEVPSFISKEMRREVFKDREVFYPAKLRFYKEWLDRIPGSRLVVTQNSGHGIPWEEPELIVEEIRQMVSQRGNH